MAPRKSSTKTSSKTPFDHINAIYNNQKLEYFDELTDADKKTFNVYVINMGISMNPNFISLVNEVNKYWDELSSRSVYLFYSQLIPKGRYFNKWIKGNKSESYDDWMIELVVKHFEISISEAKMYISQFLRTEEGRTELRSILQGYGISDKQLKKVKL